MRALNDFVWPVEGVGGLAEALARHARVGSTAEKTSFRATLQSACVALRLEVEAIEISAGAVDERLREAGPGLLELPGRGWMGIVSHSRGKVRLLGRDLRVSAIPEARVREELCEPVEAPLCAEIDRLLTACAIEGKGSERAKSALLRERTRYANVGRLWQFRESPGTSFWRQLVSSGLVRKLVLYCATHALEFLLWILAWWLLGAGALSGRVDRGWLMAWALLLATMVPLRMAVLWLQGRVGIGLGGLLKQRLLLGALRLDQDLIRREGSGQLLGRVIESETVESLALGGGLGALSAIVELILAAVVLAAGAAPWLHGALLAVLMLAIGGLGWLYYRRRLAWTRRRLAMTDDLVEQMAGHRTRIAQQPPSRWHEGEDAALTDHLDAAASMDGIQVLLTSVAPRLWLLAGLSALVPAFVWGGEPGRMAVGVGGVLLAHQALKRLSCAASQITGAAISWMSVKTMFETASASEEVSGALPAAAGGNVVLDAHDLTYRYENRPEEVLRGASLRIQRGDRVLLQGESGGGKSTFASLLVGLREPHSGLLLSGGLDRQTLGMEGWRRRVVAAPQYHENHLLSAPLAFNLLMGRQWPPSEDDLREAGEVCHELGLGGLLERMPGGLQQMVGETGWQLSQGERSRVFMARALLQRADLVVLDESFAALDPETLRVSLECVLRRAPALLVVAHP